MAYNALNNLIDAYIYANGVQAITGQILNGVLKQMVSQLGSGYHLMGVAVPATVPEQNDFAMAYFAATAGEYTDFGGITLAAGEVAVLLTYGNGSWEKQTIYNVPTGTADLENTANFITNAVTDLVNYYTKTEVDDTLANYPTLEALATALADYYTKTEIDTILAGYTTNTALASALADYYNKNDIDGLLSVVNAALADRYTKSETDTKLGDYYKKTETYDKDEVDSIVAALSRQEYIVAWDGLAEPDINAIPAGVTVTYNATPYTGTLDASASTVNKIYMVWNGVAYDMYGTSQDGGYSWVPMGTTTVDLSQYATKAEVSQLQQELPLNLINKGIVSEWDGYTSVTNRFVSLVQGHIYKFAIKFQNSGSLENTANVKLMTGTSLSTVKKIIDLGNRSITAGDIVTAELLWSDASVENYRLGVYTINMQVLNGSEISVMDITISGVATNTARLASVAPIGFISAHETDKIAITDTTITIPKNTRIIYGLNGYSYTATQSSDTVINRDSNYEQLIVFNIGTKTIGSRMINAVQTNDVILFLVQNYADTKRKISLHPSLYTYDGESPFLTGDEISAKINASYPFKSGSVPSIPSQSTTYTAISGITLVNGHRYRVKLVAASTFTAPSDFNLKIMTANSNSTVFRVFQMGGTSVSSLSTDFVWEEQTADDYRCGFFGDGIVNVGISVYIEDITIDTIDGIKWDVIERNKHKEASLVSTVSHRGNDAIKVAGKLSLLHFSDVHGNTANLANIVTYGDHYSDLLDDIIHTGDSVLTKMSDTNPFVSVEGAENILNVIGNHEAWLNTSDPDYYATEKQTYDKIFAPSIANWGVVQPTGAAENGYCYYYKDFTTAGFRLIVLDSVHWHYRNGTTDSNPAQKAWFESVLADARTNNLRVVCAMHYPPQNGIVPVANNTGWNAPILPDSGGLVGDGWYAADEIFDCVDAFMTAGGKFNGWIMGHTHEDFFGKVFGHTEQPIVVIGTANGSGYIYDKFVPGTVAQDNFNIITFENLNSKDYIKIVKMGGDCDVLMRSKKTICYNVTDGIIISTT